MRQPSQQCAQLSSLLLLLLQFSFAICCCWLLCVQFASPCCMLLHCCFAFCAVIWSTFELGITPPSYPLPALALHAPLAMARYAPQRRKVCNAAAAGAKAGNAFKCIRCARLIN